MDSPDNIFNHPVYFSSLGGEKYMESINCAANIAMMTFHAAMIRAKFGKLGMVCIAGAPNVGKTKELKVRYRVYRKHNYLKYVFI